MFKFVALVAFVASANAGVIAPQLLAAGNAGVLAPQLLSAAAPVAIQTGAIAAGPAIGATLLGRTTVNAPETTIVKQQVVVDQPEYRYRAVPTVVQTAPIVQQVAVPQVAVARTIQQVAVPQVAVQQVQQLAVPQVAVARTVQQVAVPQVQQIAVAAPQVQQVAVAAPQVAVAKSIVAPQVLAAPQISLAAPQVAVARSVIAPQVLAAPQVALAATQIAGNSIQTVASPWAYSSQLVAGVGSQTLLASPTSTLVGSPSVLALKK